MIRIDSRPITWKLIVAMTVLLGAAPAFATGDGEPSKPDATESPTVKTPTIKTPVVRTPTPPTVNPPVVRASTPPDVRTPTPPTIKPPVVRAPTPPTVSTATAMSPQCQQLVSDYVAAAQAKDGPRALAGYQALKAQGGCGVLGKVDRAPPKTPAANDSRFIARGATPLTDDVIGRCDASPAECAARARQLEAGASPAAAAALYMHAINVGLNLGSQIGSGMMMAVPRVTVPQPTINTRSSPVRTVAPSTLPRPAPPTRSSDITGTTR